MAGGAGGSGGGGRHWLADEDPGFRNGMLEKLTIRLAPHHQPRHEPYSQEAQSFVAKIEEEAFNRANSKENYIRNISNMLISMEKRKSEGLQRQMQSRSQLQRANAPQALHGGNSSVIPEAVMMPTPRPSSQLMTPINAGLVPNQHMVYSCTPNTQIEIEKKHPDMMSIMDRCLNFQPPIATVGPGVQPSPQPMQSGSSQSQMQYPVRQPQAINFVGCSPSSVSKPAIRPYSQQNHLLGHNDSLIGRQQQQFTRMNQQTLGVNKQEMNMQRYQMVGAQQGDASKIQVSQLSRLNNQQDASQTDLQHLPFKACKPEPMTPPLQQINGAQQSTSLCQNSPTPASMGSAKESDITENMFCQIKYWKDAYYSKFVELEHTFVVPTLTKEQFSSLPAEKASAYKKRVEFKKSIRAVLKFLLLRKSDVHEGVKLQFPKYEKHIHVLLHIIEKTKGRDAKVNTGYQLQNCGEGPHVLNLTGNISQITAGQRQQKQSADASILRSRQTTTARTPPACQHNNHNHLLGIATSSSSSSSLGTLQSWSTSMLECLAPSPVARPVEAPDSSCTPTKPTTSASPLQAEIVAGQGEDQARGGDRTSVTKKPIDRLIDAMRSSSPAALRRSANSIWSVLSISDIVPHGKIGTILDCKTSQQQQFGGSNSVNKMKRVFTTTASCSESLLSGSIDGSCLSFEWDASDSASSSEISFKRQKTQNANDALLEEIKSANSTLVDTVISMSGDNGTDGIASCNGGTMIKFSYSAVSLSPSVRSLFAAAETSLVLPAKLFVPADYPSSSPVVINHEEDEVLRRNSSALSVSVDVAFRHVLGDLPEPRSIKETAKAWDACVRKAITEFAHQHGGGTVSSMLGLWERCVAA